MYFLLLRGSHYDYAAKLILSLPELLGGTALRIAFVSASNRLSNADKAQPLLGCLIARLRRASLDCAGHAGGRAYGYRAVKDKPGELEIVEPEAEIVRHIFADYISGKTPRQIAHDLNKCGARPPRGTLWNGSTINGHVARGSGMILNDLYAGRITWNKVRMVKDPATGKRLSRPNPKAQYKLVDAPHLRIIEDATFKAAQVIKIERRRDATPASAQKARAPKRVFSGLIRCGSCGGMSSVGSDRKGRGYSVQRTGKVDRATTADASISMTSKA